MTAEDNYKLIIPQGRTLRREFVWEDEDGQPQSLANYTVHMKVKNKDGVIMLTASSETGEFDIEPDGLVGEIHMRIGADKTAAVTEKGEYDIIFVSTTDPTEVVEFLSGKAPLDDSVTFA